MRDMNEPAGTRGIRAAAMGRRAAAAGLLGAAMLAAPGLARAQEVAVRSFATAIVGYSDNATFQTNDTLRTSASFLELRPGVGLWIDGKRTSEVLAYSLRMNQVLTDQDNTFTYSNNALFRVTHQVNARDAMTVEVGATQGRTSSFLVLANQGGAPLAAGQPQVVHFVTGHVGETYSHQFTPRVTGFQNIIATAYVPTDTESTQARSWAVTNMLGLARAWKRDELRGELTTGYAVFDAIRVGGVVTVPRQPQLLGTATLRWQRDLTPLWQSTLALGATIVANAEDPANRAWGPYALATLRRNFRQGSAYVTYSHTVQQNVFIGQTLSVDQLSAGFAVPLDGRGRYLATSAVSYGRGETLSTGQAGVPNTQYTFVQGEAALTWIVSNALRATGRFTRLQQMGGSEIGQAPTFNYNAITLEASVMLPEPRTPILPPL